MGELNRWIRFEAEEPFLSGRVDLAAGLICSTIANANRDPKKVAPFHAHDFMPLLAQNREKVEVELKRIGMGFPDPEDEDDATLQRMVAAYG